MSGIRSSARKHARIELGPIDYLEIDGMINQISQTVLKGNIW